MTLRLPLLGERAKALETCGYCPKLCRAVCPVSDAVRRETLTPWGKMSVSWFASRGDVEVCEDVAAVTYACTGCLRCKANCDHENPVAETLAAGRADYFAAGLAPQAARDVAGRFEQLNADTARAAGSLDDLLDASSTTALVVGCGYLRHLPEEARAAVKAVVKLAGPVRLMRECCGLPLLEAGDRPGFLAARARIDAALAGAGRVIAVDPGCARILGDKKPELLVELAVRALGRLGPARSLLAEPLVRWHDPCHLGRGLGLYEPPRTVLGRALGRPPAEFSRNRKQAACSGAGGLLPATMPEASAAIARSRIGDHEDRGGGVVVTACAGSLRRFRASGARAVDLCSVIAESLENEG